MFFILSSLPSKFPSFPLSECRSQDLDPKKYLMWCVLGAQGANAGLFVCVCVLVGSRGAEQMARLLGCRLC